MRPNFPPLYQRKSSYANNFLEWCLCVETLSTVAHLRCKISVLCTKISNPWRTSTKTSATSMWPSPFWKSSGIEGFLYTGKKGGELYQSDQVNVPQQDSTELFLKSGMMDQRFRNVKSWRRRGCNVVPQRGAPKYPNIILSNRMSKRGDETGKKPPKCTNKITHPSVHLSYPFMLIHQSLHAF